MDPRKKLAERLKYAVGLESAIKRERVDRFHFRKKETDDSLTELRLPIFYFGVLAILFIFLARLFSLTVISGSYNRELADNNRIRLLTIEAARGDILDRNGEVVAFSRRALILEKDQLTSEISENTAKELTDQGLAGEDFEGTLGKIQIEVRRLYPLGEDLAHVLGYVSQVAPEDVIQRGIGASDGIGRLGIESTYDNFLRGKSGKKLVEVDASEKRVSILGTVEGVSGKTIHLTIDSKLQKVAAGALKKQLSKTGSRGGALVVTKVVTGEVLALVSLPSFDPSDIGRFVTSDQKPLFNRAVQGNYPPGSVFKIVSALAGLESGEITKETEIEDVGEFTLGGERFSNWFYNTYGRRDGILKIDRAIGRSNDIFFYRLGEKTGQMPISQMAIKLGLGQKTGIDLGDESLGLVPDEVWKSSSLEEDWYLGDTLHLAIGQGFILTTPIQINSLTAFMAGGSLMKPYLVAKIEPDTTIGPKILGQNLVKDGNFKKVREGMKLACQTGGTGWPFFNAKYSVGCKTGTAEISQGNPHAWFTAFAPYDNSQVAITVLVENGGEGSSVAAPVALEVLDWYFGKK